MSIRIFASALNASKMFDLQRSQYSEKLLMSGTVPGSATGAATTMARTAVSNLGHFLCQYVTGHFSCRRTIAGEIIDDAINHLRGQLIDGAGQKKLFNDRIPLDLWLSPGRERDATTLNAVADSAGGVPVSPPPYPLFYPHEFEYLFSANSDILLDLANDSDLDIDFEITFHGIRILSKVSVQGAISE